MGCDRTRKVRSCKTNPAFCNTRPTATYECFRDEEVPYIPTFLIAGSLKIGLPANFHILRGYIPYRSRQNQLYFEVWCEDIGTHTHVFFLSVVGFVHYLLQ